MERWNGSAVWAIALLLMLSVATTPGCESKSPTEVCEPSLETHMIIVNPLMPTPGDIIPAKLTVQAVGEGCGAWPAYHWEVSGGELLIDTGISVEWLVPQDPGIYQVICRASLGGSADMVSTTVMVRNFDYLPTGRIAALKPQIIGNQMIIFSEAGSFSALDDRFQGWGIFSVSPQGGVATKISQINQPAAAGGSDFHVAAGGEYVWGSFVINYVEGLRQQRRNVWRFPTMGLGGVNVSVDEGPFVQLRFNQHRTPYSNSAGNMVVWMFHKIDDVDASGVSDLFNIAFWEDSRPTGSGNYDILTSSFDTIQGYYRNIMPMFTPDDEYIVYFVDSTGFFEPCLIPMGASAPDTAQRRALMVDDGTGIFRAAGVGSSRRTIDDKTLFQWHPDPGRGVLAFIDDDDRLVIFDVYGARDGFGTASVTVVDDLHEVQSFAWAPGGEALAAATPQGVFLVSAAGSARQIFSPHIGDRIVGLAFSPHGSEPRLGFRLLRRGRGDHLDSWSALVIVDLAREDDKGNSVWSYASPLVPLSRAREPDVPYTWQNVFWQDDDTVIAPFVVHIDRDKDRRDLRYLPDIIDATRHVVLFRSRGY